VVRWAWSGGRGPVGEVHREKGNHVMGTVDSSDVVPLLAMTTTAVALLSVQRASSMDRFFLFSHNNGVQFITQPFIFTKKRRRRWTV
jgi:hypothetical protein